MLARTSAGVVRRPAAFISKWQRLSSQLPGKTSLGLLSPAQIENKSDTMSTRYVKRGHERKGLWACTRTIELFVFLRYYCPRAVSSKGEICCMTVLG